MLSYEGIFFESDMVDLIHSLETEKLAKVNDKLHCTFKYHPTEKEIFNNLVGEYFDIYLVGYGNNNRNSAFMITLPEELKEYYTNLVEQNQSGKTR